MELLTDDLLTNTLMTDIDVVLTSFALCVVNCFILRLGYLKFGNPMSSKIHIGNILPLLGVIVFLVIVVVKSSLALSLGLVGALSIVRFRTPIKEPEELVYLFHGIALGLGYGAGQIVVTAIISACILIVSIVLSRSNLKSTRSGYSLSINLSSNSAKLDDIFGVISASSSEFSLLRVDSSKDLTFLVFKLHVRDSKDFEEISDELKKIDANAEIAFSEHNTNW